MSKKTVCENCVYVAHRAIDKFSFEQVYLCRRFPPIPIATPSGLIMIQAQTTANSLCGEFVLTPSIAAV